MSWRAQNRSKDTKTPSARPAMSRKPKPALCGIQPYVVSISPYVVVGLLAHIPTCFKAMTWGCHSPRVRTLWSQTALNRSQKHIDRTDNLGSGMPCPIFVMALQNPGGISDLSAG
jgi:hypothetical protein